MMRSNSDPAKCEDKLQATAATGKLLFDNVVSTGLVRLGRAPKICRKVYFKFSHGNHGISRKISQFTDYNLFGQT